MTGMDILEFRDINGPDPILITKFGLNKRNTVGGAIFPPPPSYSLGLNCHTFTFEQLFLQFITILAIPRS